ncbi:hypothetical protein Taro_045118 [Colocasia esculenta]|uniref:Uncharacterized protein n=1 Tax=Colocasia esculenta TaxID=4460 RepID=A0A843X498_COLES|nr:hypothetical protein [Colocasia esculenta]
MAGGLVTAEADVCPPTRFPDGRAPVHGRDEGSTHAALCAARVDSRSRVDELRERDHLAVRRGSRQRPMPCCSGVGIRSFTRGMGGRFPRGRWEDWELGMELWRSRSHRPSPEAVAGPLYFARKKGLLQFVALGSIKLVRTWVLSTVCSLEDSHPSGCSTWSAVLEILTCIGRQMKVTCFSYGTLIIFILPGPTGASSNPGPELRPVPAVQVPPNSADFGGLEDTAKSHLPEHIAKPTAFYSLSFTCSGGCTNPTFPGILQSSLVTLGTE